MPVVGFEPAILAVKQLQTYVLDRMATGISRRAYTSVSQTFFRERTHSYGGGGGGGGKRAGF
jgi:hypothetical protein